ncbi:MAG: hypothetical protein HZA24_10175 [Nitrospirae bacterium]|nr:hypothetical protein [Nitrospirota bacterium]
MIHPVPGATARHGPLSHRATTPEGGTAAGHTRTLSGKSRTRYRLDFHLIPSGVIIHLDDGQCKEDIQSQLFITYPWNMFSVNNPA